jgi:hypothetical protein
VKGRKLSLVVFTVEGFGGGNNHTQYLAGFSVDTGEKGKQHFSLLDVVPVAGKGWRGVVSLDAKVSRNPRSTETLIAIDALEVTGNDAPNFPSKPIKVNFLIKGGRLVEQKLPPS